MRTFLLAAAVIGLAAPANSATRNFGITSFTKIRVAGPYKVSLATGVAPFAKASGSPNAIDRVAIDVRGDTLVVQANPSWGGFPGSDPGPVEVSIGTHDLTKNATWWHPFDNEIETMLTTGSTAWRLPLMCLISLLALGAAATAGAFAGDVSRWSPALLRSSRRRATPRV